MMLNYYFFKLPSIFFFNCGTLGNRDHRIGGRAINTQIWQVQKSGLLKHFSDLFSHGFLNS